MAFKVHTLSNGLRVVLYPESYRSAYMTLITRAGPRFERPEESGLSHIFEHLVVSDPEIHYEMESIGEGLSNAETDAEDVSYFFSFPKRNLLKGMEAFARLWTASVSAADFERERTVIGIEYGGTGDLTPHTVADDLFMRTAWRGHPLGKNDTEPWQADLPNLTREQFESFRRRVNCGRNAALAVVGEVPLPLFWKVLERSLGTLPEGELLPVVHQPLPVREGFTVVKQAGAQKQAHCLLGFPLPRLLSAQRRALDVLGTYLGGESLFSSVLFRRVREEQALVYYIASEVDSFYDSGAFKVYWTCPPANVEPVLNVVLGEIRRIAHGRISSEEFRRARHVLALQKESQLEEPLTVSMALAEELIRSGRVSNPNLWPKQARRARRADLVRFAREHLNPERAVLALYGPVENLEPRILV
ncbi:MAG: pitrilysin family protein [Patescibacteria group bacterium]